MPFTPKVADLITGLGQTTDLPVDMGNKKTAPPWMAVENLLACIF